MCPYSLVAGIYKALVQHFVWNYAWISLPSFYAKRVSNWRRVTPQVEFWYLRFSMKTQFATKYIYHISVDQSIFFLQKIVCVYKKIQVTKAKKDRVKWGKSKQSTKPTILPT